VRFLSDDAERTGALHQMVVVPAKAGTHNRRCLLFGELLQQAADTFRITTTEAMGPRLRGDDGENYFAPAFCA
jgi:hypothetical protein